MLTTIKSEGSLISADLLVRIQGGEAHGQRAADFGLAGRTRLIDEIAACWSDAKAYWEAFQHALRRLKEDESGATVTREQWVLPLLRSLGFDKVTFAKQAAEVGGRTYAISHREDDSGLPIHIEGARFEIDKRPPTGRPRISPHALLQEYLNRTDHLWGVVTNGYLLRVLRDSSRLSRPIYLEFDLGQMMESDNFTDFQVFYRIVHRSRFPKTLETVHECLLEGYYQDGIEAGGRVRERLRDGVEKAIRIFGNGFLAHPGNVALREKIENGSLPAPEYYRQLLRLIYRFLFLMVSEERKLVGPAPEDDHLHKIYFRYYSIMKLREVVEHHFNPDDRHHDLWEGIKQTFALYCNPDSAQKFKIALLNGDLFGSRAIPDLEAAGLGNVDFLRGFANLSLFGDGGVTRRINYAHLDVEELGSVYESLLDYHPVFKKMDGVTVFELLAGMERKTTGSYYTRPELVQELIKSALVPIIEDRLKPAGTKEAKEKALLSLRVCDPAAGSGHFLLAAARRIGMELARVRTGEEQPTPREFKDALREVIRHCIYGVDINPLAVDLCKVALWLEGHNQGKPLTFLDHRIRCGNSLVGIDTLERLKSGIPDEAFKPVTGDDKEVAKKIKALNRRERRDYESGQLRIHFDIDDRISTDLRDFASQMSAIDKIEEQEASDVNRKQAEYERIRTGAKWMVDWTAANIRTAAFFSTLLSEDDPAIPTHGRLLDFIERPKAAHGQMVGKANALSVHHRFLHWALEFPDAMEAGGFDVVLGNPPWERIKLQEQEFFATKDIDIAHARNKAERTRLIKALEESNPRLLAEFEEAKHTAEANSKFVREGGRFGLTAVGDVNTYALFAELATRLLNASGRSGIIVPTGIATDDTCKAFFSSLNENKALASLHDFENREALFPGVHRSYKFSLLTVSKKPVESTRFAFFLTNTDQLSEEMRNFSLSPEDIALINPNTRTAPVFRTKVDAELTRKIYRKVPVLVNERTGENPWGIEFKAMFHMSNDSHLFYRMPADGRLPLYEAKMIWQFDHRFGTYEGMDEDSESTQLITPTLAEYQDPNFSVTPRYWVDEREVLMRLAYPEDREERERFNSMPEEEQLKYLKVHAPKWLIGFRDITNATNERTSIFTVLPKTGVGNKIPLLILNDDCMGKSCCLLALFDSLPFDFVARQKIGGTTLNFFLVKQFPILAPNSYTNENISFITSRALELAYTSYDLKPFAEDMGYQGEPFEWDEERRAVIRAELDAYYAMLYGLTRDELRYILDPQDVYGESFPGETFRVLKEKETRQYGEYRTRRLVLEAWDRLFGRGT